MHDVRLEPAVSYRFLLVIDGYAFGSFSKIEGIKASYDVMKVKEGGENGFVHALPGRISYSNVTLTRSIDRSSALLAAWFTEFQTALNQGGRHRPSNASITAVDGDHDPVATWNFAAVVPIIYTGPSFNSNGSELAIEKFEFAHHGFWNDTSPLSVAGR